MLTPIHINAVSRRAKGSLPLEGLTVPVHGRQRLNAGCITDQTRGFDETLRRHIIGQEAVVATLTCSFSRAVYHPLEREHLEQVFQKFLAEIHIRALEQAKVPLVIKVSPEARALIITRGTDLSLGARRLRRAVEAALVDPLSRLIAAHRIEPGDVIEVECEGDDLGFYRACSDSAVVVP